MSYFFRESLIFSFSKHFLQYFDERIWFAVFFYVKWTKRYASHFSVEGNFLHRSHWSKLRKKVQFQKCKKALFAFSKMAKNQFLHQKKVKIAFLVVLSFFLVQKNDFFVIFEIEKKCVFVLLKLHFFSNFRALCSSL